MLFRCKVHKYCYHTLNLDDKCKELEKVCGIRRKKRRLLTENFGFDQPSMVFHAEDNRVLKTSLFLYIALLINKRLALI